MSNSLQIRAVSPFDPVVLDFIEQLNQNNLAMYPPEACYLDPPEVLARENCMMIGAYVGTTLCGMGAVKYFADYGEIKRMFVEPTYRGKGISKLVLEHLLDSVKKRGLRFARLETGAKFEAAVSLYRKCGFTECESFGSYKTNGISLFMEKDLNLP